jgi:uncharacterized membrane protein
MTLPPRYLLGGAAAVAYASASLWLMTRTPPASWTPVALIVPMLAFAAAGAWRSGRRNSGAAALVTAGGLVVLAARGGAAAPERIFLAEHLTIHGLLALSFGLTLRPGVRPLIARLADRLHGGLTPAQERYTRHVTLAWTIYFVAMMVVSALLFATLPFRLWALCANLGTPLALVAMFAGEYWLRFRLHPEFERSSPRDMIRAYRQSRQAATLPPAGGASR